MRWNLWYRGLGGSEVKRHALFGRSYETSGLEEVMWGGRGMAGMPPEGELMIENVEGVLEEVRIRGRSNMPCTRDPLVKNNQYFTCKSFK